MNQAHEDYQHFMGCQDPQNMPDVERAYCAGWRKGEERLRTALADVWCHRGKGWLEKEGRVSFSLSKEDYYKFRDLLTFVIDLGEGVKV